MVYYSWGLEFRVKFVIISSLISWSDGWTYISYALATDELLIVKTVPYTALGGFKFSLLDL